jgi:hypothetical protein
MPPTRWNRILVALIALLALVVFASPAGAKKKKKKSKSNQTVAAQSVAPQAVANTGNGEVHEEIYEYVAELTCGINDDSGFDRVLPGEYTGVVNVHNPSMDETMARSLFSLSFPTSTNSSGIRASFGPRQSRQLNCGDVLGGTFDFPDPIPPSDYIQGFLVIQSLAPLNVVVRYSVSDLGGGPVSTDVEPIPGRKVQRPREPVPDTAVICHIPPGNPANRHTIEVEEAAVGAHLAHGDYVGDCE